MSNIQGVPMSKQATADHYGAQLEESIHHNIMAKVQGCMGGAEIEGEHRDLILDMLAEDGVVEPLMNIVANVDLKDNPSYDEAQYAVNAVKEFVIGLENRLYEHFRD